MKCLLIPKIIVWAIWPPKWQQYQRNTQRLILAWKHIVWCIDHQNRPLVRPVLMKDKEPEQWQTGYLRRPTTSSDQDIVGNGGWSSVLSFKCHKKTGSAPSSYPDVTGKNLTHCIILVNSLQAYRHDTIYMCTNCSLLVQNLRSSVVIEETRDVLCQSESCQLVQKQTHLQWPSNKLKVITVKVVTLRCLSFSTIKLKSK